MRRLLGAVLLVLLAGCSGPGGAAGTSTAGTGSDTTASATPTPSTPLTSFRCASAEGGWTATGVVSNPSKASVSYEVSVVVSNTNAGTASTVTLEDVPAKADQSFTIDGVQPTGEDPSCQVQVKKLD